MILWTSVTSGLPFDLPKSTGAHLSCWVAPYFCTILKWNMASRRLWACFEIGDPTPCLCFHSHPLCTFPEGHTEMEAGVVLKLNCGGRRSVYPSGLLWPVPQIKGHRQAPQQMKISILNMILALHKQGLLLNQSLLLWLRVGSVLHFLWQGLYFLL